MQSAYMPGPLTMDGVLTMQGRDVHLPEAEVHRVHSARIPCPLTLDKGGYARYRDAASAVRLHAGPINHGRGVDCARQGSPSP